MTPIRALVVDDEPLGREGVRLRLAAEPGIEVVGEAADGEEAIEAIVRLRPDLVFLDVQMPGRDGFQVLDAVSGRHLPIVVFVTAYDAYALRAFDVHALDYLLKPYTAQRFRAAVARARAELAGGDQAPFRRQVGALLDALNAAAPARPTRLTVRDGERYLVLRVEEIDSAESDGNYVVVQARGRGFRVRITLKELAATLDPGRFARIHRTALVNLDRVREVLPDESGDYTVLLETGRRLRMSRSYRENVLGLAP